MSWHSGPCPCLSARLSTWPLAGAHGVETLLKAFLGPALNQDSEDRALETWFRHVPAFLPYIATSPELASIILTLFAPSMRDVT